MSSLSTYLPRRSSRLGQKRWFTHFTKVGHGYNKNSTTHFMNIYISCSKEPFNKNHDYTKGVTNNFTKQCFYINAVYESIIFSPQFLLDRPTLWEVSYEKAKEFLMNKHLQGSKKYWAMKLKETLYDYFQMMEYITLCI